MGYEPTTLPQNPIRDCLAPPQGSLRPWGAAPEGASRTPTLGAHLQHTCGLARPSELVRIPRHTWYVSVHEQGPPHARPQASVLCRGGGSLSSRGSHSKGGVGVACGWWLGICYCNRPTSRAGLRDRPTHFLPGLPSARSAAPRRLQRHTPPCASMAYGSDGPLDAVSRHPHRPRASLIQNPIVRACSARRSARPRGVKVARTRRHAAHWASPDRPAASRGHVKRFVSSHPPAPSTSTEHHPRCQPRRR